MRIVLNRLAGLIPSGNPQTDQAITYAMKELDDGLSSGLFLDDSHLNPQGGVFVFDETANSVRTLMGISGAPAAVSEAIGVLDCAGGLLAQTAIADAIAAGGDPQTIVAAQQASAEALEEIREDEFDEAIERYENAWENAEGAIGH